MAFVRDQFAPVGNQSRPRKGGGSGGAPAVWSYFHASDALAAVKAAGYFNEIRGMLSPGDVIWFSQNGAAAQVITVNAVPTDSSNVTIHTADINSA